MRKPVSLVLGVLFALVTSVGGARVAMADAVWAEVSALYGVSRIHFQDILSSPDQTWVIAQITASSSYAYSDSRKILLKRVYGTYHVTMALTQAPPQDTFSYDWSDSGAGSVRVVAAPDTPFIQGGMVVGRINPTESGAAQFTPVYLIPPKWALLVQPALAYYKAHRALFEGGDASQTPAQRVDQLRRLLTDANPFLVGQAAAALSSLGQLDASALAAQIVQARGLRQALLTLLLLKDAPEAAKSTAADPLIAAIDAAPDVSAVVGIGLGAFADQESSGQRGSDPGTLKLLDRLNNFQRQSASADSLSTAKGQPLHVSASLGDRPSASAADDYLTDILVDSMTWLDSSPPSGKP